MQTMHLDPILVVWHVCAPEDQRAGTNTAETDPLSFDPGFAWIRMDSWDVKALGFLVNIWDDVFNSPG